MGHTDWAGKDTNGDMGHTDWAGKTKGGSGQAANGDGSVLVPAGTAGIVLRAAVETFGPAGDAELHLTVKWPASALASAQHQTSKSGQHSHKSAVDAAYDQEGNIRTEANSPKPR